MIKILPHGVPELIHGSAEDYGALDFKVWNLTFSETWTLALIDNR